MTDTFLADLQGVLNNRHSLTYNYPLIFQVCSCYSLPRRHLERLVTSRSGLIKARHFRSLEDLERYAEDAVSPIYYLLLNVAGIKDIHADHAASHLGKAQGIANILR